MKIEQKGIAAAAIAVIVVVVIAVVSAGVFLVLRGREAGVGVTGVGVRNATATVKLHDAQIIDIAQVASEYLPNIPGVSVTASGTITINSFSVTDVTVKLHNSTTGEWITVVENLDITDMTTINNLTEEIASGTYDKVSVHIGTITIDMSWTPLVFSYTIDYGQMQIPQELLPYIQAYLPSTGGYTVPAGSFNTSVTLNQTFEISFSSVIEVTEGENQVFDVDTGAPFDFGSGLGSDMSYDLGENMNYSMQEGQLNASHMNACEGVCGA